MKIYLEADLLKGSGAFRWEGMTSRRLRKFAISFVAVVGTVAYALWHRL